MHDASPLLAARGLGRRAPDGSHWLLRDVSLTLLPGERVAAVGATGSGKTLLLRALALLDPLDEGEVLWRGAAVADADVPTFRSRVVYLHQRPPLLDASVEENLRAPYRLHVHRDARFDRPRLLAELDRLDRGEEFLRRTARDLSGGEAQLVALLRALPFEPELLLLDEPTAALDAASRTSVEGLIDHWHAARPEARALLWVTHDPAQAERVADRRLRMAGGRLEEAAAA